MFCLYSVAKELNNGIGLAEKNENEKLRRTHLIQIHVSVLYNEDTFNTVVSIDVLKLYGEAVDK